MHRIVQTLLGGLLACGSIDPGGRAPSERGQLAPAAVPDTTWLKGQLHAHTRNSGDSATDPADAMRWYAAHGFDFVVVTDHNYVTVIDGGPVLAIPGVELTQNLAECTPPPEPGLQCLLHVNALFVDPARAGPFRFPATDERDRLALYRRAQQAARELGGLPMLNHPNFHYAADAATIAALRETGGPLFELANASIDANNHGDAAHPSTEALWDRALQLGAPVWGVATDDAHHYDDAARVVASGEVAYVGDRGFVMVRAAREPAAIRRALEAGEFYSSTGVILTRLERGADRIELATATPHTFICIGEGGRELRRSAGLTARCERAADSRYVRAVVDAPDGARAWTQPI